MADHVNPKNQGVKVEEMTPQENTQFGADLRVVIIDRRGTWEDVVELCKNSAHTPEDETRLVRSAMWHYSNDGKQKTEKSWQQQETRSPA